MNLTRSSLTVIRTMMLSLLMLLFSTVGHAEENSMVEAKRLFEEGEAFFQAGNYQKALSRYQQAYSLKPLPGFHFNIGQCYRNLNQYEKAIDHFQQYIDQSPNPKHQEDAKQLIVYCQEMLARQKDKKAASAGITSNDINTSESRQSDTVIRQATLPESNKNKPRSRIRPILLWSGVAVSGALLLTGTITGSLALSKSSQFKDPATSSNELRDLKDSGESFRTAANVSFGLGLATATATVVYYFLTDTPAKKQKLSASPTRQGGMIFFGGQF